jgi:class 3 adenylate cyclase
LNELAATSESRISGVESELSQKELNEKALIFEKLKLKGNLEAKEIEALALSDSLLKRELVLKEQALNLEKEKVKAEKKASEANRQKLMIYGLSLVVLLVLALVYFVYRNLLNQQKTNKLLFTKNAEIKQQNEEISTQRDTLEELAIELQQQKEEIESQRDNLQELNVQITSQRNVIEEERDQSDKLLLNILPDEIAHELKTTGKTKPKSYQMATVLFSDFKGFTTIAATLSPEDIVKELEYCFLAFDEIIEKYDLEKIKTIGDAYMCAGGLPIANKTNAIDAVKAGLAIQQFMVAMKNERLSSGKPIWELRIGIHTGPVVAGVIGKHKFAYDIWGDTVNLAARMESTGEVGKVNISESTHALVKDFFQCHYRGKVEAKNKGLVDMYFVEKALQ